jgi:lactate dehydrogenase-like 2-hydroxyacid dehydrogenase
MDAGARIGRARAIRPAQAPTIVLGVPLRPSVAAALREVGTVLEPGSMLQAATVPPEAAGARVLVTIGIRRTGPEIMDALPGLGLIACYGTGYEGVDLAAANARGIAVTHGRGVNAASVADHAMALVLATVRRVGQGDRLIREGRWTSHPMIDLPVSIGLTGRRLGIWGLGEIGSRVASRAAAFEMEVAYHGRRARDVPLPFKASLLDLAAWSDVLVVTVRAGAENARAIDAAVLEALGPSGYLVNVSRGSVVDEDALLAALRAGRIAGAGLDVHATEPRHSDALTERDDVVLTPHLGGSSETAQLAATHQLLRNVAAFLAGEPLLTPVPASTGRGSRTAPGA